MNKDSSLAIIGPGLLGGSLALACKESFNVRLWGRNKQKLSALKDAGFDLVSTHLKEVITGADLIILAIPVPYMKPLVEQLLENGLEKHQLITDVGSVKTTVINELQSLLGEQGFKFIGSHPMAGSESQGFQAAKANLFRDAPCIITPDEFTEEEDLASLIAFWNSLGSITHILSPEDHDEAISRVSHIPHVLSAVCAKVALDNPNNGKYAGGGLKDTSRVASGDADLWTGILWENKDEILGHLDECVARLEEYKAALRSDSSSALTKLLTEDKTARDGYMQNL